MLKGKPQKMRKLPESTQ
jgi:hypothetical protein